MSDTTGKKTKPRGKVTKLRAALTFNGETRKAIVFRPFTIGDLVRWKAGEFSSIFNLMEEVSGWSRDQIEAIEFPDAAAVIENFMIHLPEEIRNDVQDGIIPVSSTPTPPQPGPDNGSLETEASEHGGGYGSETSPNGEGSDGRSVLERSEAP
ncbi:hypothetical protein [Microvirga sp. Mcv34]|uniref:hypothetical protein n=1 Tax=Microvirga sp. Mcv34 TaxID=2926016 RepID=UPI0021C96F35|nr:hypothetical protein [Microvirga sp. Mcv34]